MAALRTNAVAFVLLLLPLRVLTAEPREFDLTDHSSYESSRGFGYEADAPAKFSVRLPEGNYRLALTFDAERKGATMTLLAEQRRLMLEDVPAAKRKPTKRALIVNIRAPELAPPPQNAPGGNAVRLKQREIGSSDWDDKLTLEFKGDARPIGLRIEPADVPTLYLAGDSTVTDQAVAPNASWGQMLPRFFAPDIAVANHAESGETLKSFITELRLDKLLATLRAGDWVMIQFGHNDQKSQWPQTYADPATTYRSYLRTYISEIRRRGATPILVTPPERRNFDANGRIVPSLGDYPDAVRAVAAETGVAVIDLNRMSVALYEALGPDVSPRAFANEGRDHTHHDEYGAYQLAHLVVEGIRAADPGLTRGLATHLASDAGRLDPAHPPLPKP